MARSASFFLTASTYLINGVVAYSSAARENHQDHALFFLSWNAKLSILELTADEPIVEMHMVVCFLVSASKTREHTIRHVALSPQLYYNPLELGQRMNNWFKAGFRVTVGLHNSQ